MSTMKWAVFKTTKGSETPAYLTDPRGDAEGQKHPLRVVRDAEAVPARRVARERGHNATSDAMLLA